MNRLALTSTTCAFLAVLGTSALPAHAVTLSSLTANPNNSFKDIVGNVYDQFFFLPNQSGPFNIPLTADNVTIDSAPAALGGSGIVIGGSFIAGPGQANDYRLDYRVTSVAGFVINSITLTAAANATGTGTVTINENAFNGLTSVGGAAVAFDSSSAPTATSSVSFNPGYSPLFLQKDINLAVGGSGHASISIIDQLVGSGVGPNVDTVPEPSEVLGTLAFGAIGVCSYLRRLQLSK